MNRLLKCRLTCLLDFADFPGFPKSPGFPFEVPCWVSCMSDAEPVQSRRVGRSCRGWGGGWAWPLGSLAHIWIRETLHLSDCRHLVQILKSFRKLRCGRQSRLYDTCGQFYQAKLIQTIVKHPRIIKRNVFNIAMNLLSAWFWLGGEPGWWVGGTRAQAGPYRPGLGGNWGGGGGVGGKVHSP